MFLRILKKDLKRRRTINIIMVLFVILATMFVASGLNNVITVVNGTDYYFEQAGIGDYIIITVNDKDRNSLDEMLATTKEIDSYSIEDVFFSTNESVFDLDDNKLETKNMTVFQSYEDSGIKFFDENNEEPAPLKQGHCYAGTAFFKNNDAKVGDRVVIKVGLSEMEVTLDGAVKDALLGSDFMGNSRFLLSKEDYETLSADEFISNNMAGQICYIFTDNVKAVDAATSNCEHVNFSKPNSTIKLAYVMDMIVAFIVLILSVCLVIVSFVVLKFAISLTISEEYREIGVMKAIGIGSYKIRSLYITKYLLIAIAGSIIGLVLSYPFGDLLIKSVSESMVLGNSFGIWANVIGAILVVLSIVGFAYLSTNKVKKATPVDAIRSGQTGERYKKKSFLKLRKSKVNAPTFMALNDLLSSPKRYLTIIVTFALCTLFVLVLVNTVNTMTSDRLVYTFASKSDMYVDATTKQEKESTFKFTTREEWYDYFDGLEDELEAKGIPCEMFFDFQVSCPVIFNGETYALNIQQGIGTKMTDYVYYEGVAPGSPDEIAITPQIAEKLGAKIGDTVTIDYGTEKRDVTITAYFQTMNQLGEVIRIHEDAPTDVSKWTSYFAWQINYTDNPDKKEYNRRIDVLEDVFEKVYTASEYQQECLAVVPTMKMVQNMLLALTLVVVLFVTILMERSFISEEKTEIAILKSVGFRNNRIILWQVVRFGLVAFFAAIVAAILSIPMTYLCITPIFGMMGANQVTYEINAPMIFLGYPLIIMAMTVIVAFITAQCVRSIKSNDTSSIE